MSPLGTEEKANKRILAMALLVAAAIQNAEQYEGRDDEDSRNAIAHTMGSCSALLLQYFRGTQLEEDTRTLARTLGINMSEVGEIVRLKVAHA